MFRQANVVLMLCLLLCGSGGASVGGTGEWATYTNRHVVVMHLGPKASLRWSCCTDIGLRLHDAGLSIVDNNLPNSYSDQAGRQIKKGLRGLPMAIGGLFALLLAWLVVARIAHERQSILLGLAALLLLLAAIPGVFIFLLWENGFLSEGPFVSYGFGASAACYCRTENVLVVPI